jgi:SAM-dependent methyltransferase
VARRTTDVLARLETLLAARIARWSKAGVRDLCALRPGFGTPPPGLVRLLHRHRETVRAWVETLGLPGTGRDDWAVHPDRALRVRMLRWLQGRNRFLELDPDQAAALDEVYRRSFATLGRVLRDARGERELRAALERMFLQHQRRLAAFVRALDRAPGQPGAGFVFREPVSVEYPAALQLKLLGLDPATLAEPILDLGCGRHARLVRALRRRGKQAWGVDRDAPPGTFVTCADWLDAPLAPTAWGTVISHQAFSVQFRFHDLRSGPGAERYARKYMEILRALRPGGTFAYAPGLPFLERLLEPRAWSVERTPVPTPDHAASPRGRGTPRPEHRELLYACRVRRRDTARP